MGHDEFTPRYRNYVLFILFLTYVLNFLDRQLMTILLEPIKQEFGASDTANALHLERRRRIDVVDST